MATVVNHIDLSFDLDGFLDMNLFGRQITTSSDTTTLEVPNTPKDSEQRITASNTLVSILPTVAIDGVCSVCLEDFQTDLAVGLYAWVEAEVHTWAVNFLGVFRNANLPGSHGSLKH
ncbi:hypothetical protein EZV62_012823 [Acer yangbiense]|uniref:Uncharacterized protein n=1 Tax=Acer yangbiense TaxID=1000413 RepID=A0A5C7HWX7_9ROSI|nr:hypothetical protein EZV62_012823 [Acer yangbiense]